jgi:hypothetical protein
VSTWTIKGIRTNTRVVAKRRAAQASQTLGAWLEAAITQHGRQQASSDQPPPSPQEIANQLTALARRYQHIAQDWQQQQQALTQRLQALTADHPAMNRAH